MNSNNTGQNKLVESPPIGTRTRNRAPLNSTTTERVGLEDDSTASYRENPSMTDVFQESTLSQGIGTNLLDNEGLHRTRTSEDEFEAPENIDSAVEKIRSELEHLELDLPQTQGWISVYKESCDEIHNKIATLLAKVSIAGVGINIDGIDKVTELRKQLIQIQGKLQNRAQDELENPRTITLRRSVLENALQANPTQTHMPEDPIIQDVTVTENDKAGEVSQEHYDARQSITRLEQQLEEMRNKCMRIDALEKLMKETTDAHKTLHDQILRNASNISIIGDSCKSAQRETDNSILSTDHTLSQLKVVLEGVQTNVRLQKKAIHELHTSMSNVSNNSNASTASGRQRLSSTALATLEENMMDLVDKIDTVVMSNVDSLTNDADIISLIKRDIPELDKFIAVTYDKLTRYTNEEGMKPDIRDKVTSSLKRGGQWRKAVIVKYNQQKLRDLENNHRIVIEVISFSPAGSQHVHEFLEDFRKFYKGKGSDELKAAKLWREHLAPSVKLETELMKDSLSQLVEYLLITYGNLPTVIKSIL